MKRNGLKRGFSGLLALIMTVTMLLGLGIGEALFAAAEEPEGAEIVWDFEDGKLEPFKLVSGSYGTIISSIPWQHNNATAAYPRQGNYHLSTLESTNGYTAETGSAWGDDWDKMTKPSDAYKCELHSPMFRLDDPKINFLVGGGNNGVYVALCDVYGREIITAGGNGSENMIRVEWDLKYEELVGQYVFVKIVDNATSGWGHITFDDFHAVGYVDATKEILPIPPNEIVWSFETGGLAPFKIKEGEFGEGLIANWIYERNSPYGQINKDGNYFLSTVETDTTVGYDESYTGVITSPSFLIKDPTITMKLGGGAARPDELYVTIVRDSDNKVLVKYNLAALATYQYDKNGDCVVDLETEVFTSGHMLENITLTIPEADYVFGEKVHIEIVDKADKGPWGFIIVDDIRAKGDVANSVEIKIPTTYTDVAWGFEDGTIAPFSGSINAAPISDATYDPNYQVGATVHEDQILGTMRHGPVGKVGTYWLNTFTSETLKLTVVDGKVTERTVTGKETFTGKLKSPTFVLNPEDTEITMQLGGNTENGVFVYDYATNAKVGEAHPSVNDWKMGKRTVVWAEDFQYTEGQLLYMQIEDNRNASPYGFTCVDDIQFSGGIASAYDSFHWSFEDGTMAPFTTTDNFKLPNICDADYCWNGTGKSMNKDGKYYMSTIGKKGAYSEAPTGAFTSPVLLLNPANPKVSFRIGGGNNAANYVAICDAATGNVLAKVSPPAQSGTYHPLVQTSLTVSNYVEGTPVVIKIVDGTSSGWGFVHVDDFRFEGKYMEYDYRETVWSFENNTIQPFYPSTTPNGGIISTYLPSSNGTVPHGKYYLNTVQTVPESQASYDESWGGTFTSPKFMLNPDDAVITMSINGGSKDNYVAVCDAATGTELGRVSANAENKKGSWTFHDAQIDLTGKISGSEKLVLKIVDGTTATWAWIGVDNIRGSFYFPEAATLTTLKQVQAATGCDGAQWDKLLETVNNNIQNYSKEEYPKGAEFLDRIAQLQAKQSRLAKQGIKEDAAELEALAADIAKLIEEIKAANPVLGNGLMLVVTHAQYAGSHHNTHNMWPAYPGEIEDKAKYSGGSAVKLVNLNTGEVTTLLEDADGMYRDLELSYDADKVLLSYRTDKNTPYNIWEYDLGINEETGKYELTNPRQLTSLSSADDMDPLYLPSGQIVFGSTRDPKYVMCNRHIACNLYRMEADGANIIKITSSTLFERPTDILPDGRILYDRWEYNDRDFGSAQGLWMVYPDGTKQDTYYGNNSPSGATIEGKVIPGTQKVAAILSSCHDRSWGALAVIDRSNGVDGKAPVLYTWPASVKNSIRDTGAGNNIDQFSGLSIKYEDPQPLSEEYILVSRYKAAGNAKMCIFLVDIYGNETLVYEDAKTCSWDATMLAPRAKEIAASDRRNYNDDVGTFFVEDVYEGTHMQGIERGTVKTLRIVESMDKKYISQSQQWGGEGQQNPGVNWHSFEVKRVIGEVPVYEDGSAYFEVPQDVFVYFQLLDEDGRMIQSMRSGTLIQSGEKTGCIGCHEDRRIAPMTYTGTETPMALKANVEVVPNPDYVEGSNLPKTIAVNTPDVPQKRIIDFATKTDKLVAWNDPELFPAYTDLPTMNFLTEVQPVFTNNCLECHGYDKKEANLSLVPDKDVIFNAAYINLWVKRGKASASGWGNLVGVVGGGNNTFYKAKAWGSYNSTLVKKLYDGISGETVDHTDFLTDAEKRRVAEWVDLNATYYGDYCSNYSTNPGGRSPITSGERSALGDNRSLSHGGLSTSNLNKGIYFDNPEKSPILQGLTVGSDDYNNKLAIITAGRDRLRTNPDVDWRGLTTVPGNPSLSINPYKQNKMDAWRTEKVALVDAIEAANRAAIVAGTKLYDSDHEAVMAAHNAKWPGWPTATNTGNYYTDLPG